jgi:AraC family transcriptional regulator
MPPDWLRAARAQILDRPFEGVRTAGIAAAVGRHPVSLARAFRRHYGESISECVRRRRVELALSLLAHTRKPLTDIAAEVGCADQSHLTRLLREETGVTPHRLRLSISPTLQRM